MIRTTAVLLLLLALCASVAHADGASWTDKLGIAVLGAPNDGPVWGIAASYKAYEHLWIDGGAKPEDGKVKGFLGASTDLQQIADLIASLLKMDLGAMPAGSSVGGAFDTNGGMFAYAAYHIGF
jgi:hypothetical protein